MRWPIQAQLLLPMLLVVLGAIVLASGTTAYWTAQRTRADQEAGLHRVVDTLAEASYPLSGAILTQVAGLSGADLVTLDEEGRLAESTLLSLDAADAQRLADLPDREPGGPSGQVRLAGRQYLVETLPRRERWGGSTSGRLCVLYPEDRWTARIQQATYPALITGALAALAAAVVTVVLSRRLVRPIHRLVRRTAEIAASNFTPAPLPPRNDELRDLEESINRMAAQLAQFENEIRRTERMQTLGKLGAGLAHQLRNAATGGKIAIELHQRQCHRGQRDESLEIALRQFRLMESFLQRFLSLGKPAPGERAPLAVGSLVADVVDLLAPTAKHLGVALDALGPIAPLQLLGDAVALRQLLGNLILNACEAAKETRQPGPWVRVLAGRGTDGRGVICVADSGTGPPPAVQARLFEPFATGKPEGVGLGLYVARQIAEAHGGTLTWQRRGKATRFYFRFPLSTG